MAPSLVDTDSWKASNMTVHEAIKHQLKTKLKKGKGEAKEAVQETRLNSEESEGGDFKEADESWFKADESWFKAKDFVTVSHAAFKLIKVVEKKKYDQVEDLMKQVITSGVKAAEIFNVMHADKKGKKSLNDFLEKVNNGLKGLIPEKDPTPSPSQPADPGEVSVVWTVSKAAVNLLKLVSMTQGHGEVKKLMDAAIASGFEAATRFNQIFEAQEANTAIKDALEAVNKVLPQVPSTEPTHEGPFNEEDPMEAKTSCCTALFNQAKQVLTVSQAGLNYLGMSRQAKKAKYDQVHNMMDAVIDSGVQAATLFNKILKSDNTEVGDALQKVNEVLLKKKGPGSDDE